MNNELAPIPPRIIDVYDLVDFKKISQVTAYALLKKIKTYHKKEKQQVVLNFEAAAYFGISIESFESIIRNS